MRAIKLLFIICTTSLFLSGCDKTEEEEISENWTWKAFEKSFQEIDITPGTSQNVTLQIPVAPYEYNFRLTVPDEIDEVNGNPLVLNLHGGVGGAGREAHSSNSCFEPALASINAFVLSPNADRVQWYEGYNQTKIIRTLTQALINWPIDSAKLVVTGYSDGGNGTWFYSEFYGAAFSAGIAMATSYNTSSSAGGGRKIQTPMYVIHSTGDELFPIAQTQEWVEQTIAAGSDIEFVIAEGLSHYTPCDGYVEHFEDAVTWLQEEVWK